LLRFGAAADPEQAVEVDADGRGGFGVERVGHVDPGADASDARQTRDERKGERCPTGAFGTGKFGDRTNGKSAVERIVEGRDAGGCGRADDARGWRESRGDAAGEGGFDLLAEAGGGGHAEALSPYLRLLRGVTARVDLHSGDQVKSDSDKAFRNEAVSESRRGGEWAACTRIDGVVERIILLNMSRHWTLGLLTCGPFALALAAWAGQFWMCRKQKPGTMTLAALGIFGATALLAVWNFFYYDFRPPSRPAAMEGFRNF
jgi:hypothetical protein